MKTYIVTGATSGLGLAMAEQLLAANHRVILAVRDINKGAEVAETLGGVCEARFLDLTSLDSVKQFCQDWNGPIDGLINNAGVQITDETRIDEQFQLEETFLVNHLSPLLLTLGLLPFLNQGRVLFIGSGTHDPNHLAARLFGFQGEKFESISACALGLNQKGGYKRLGMDRYATSKFLNTVTTVELSRRFDASQTQFFCLDPGLMAGTGLARTAPSVQQWFWRNVLPIVARLLPDTSTTECSAAAAIWIMTSETNERKSGEVFSFDRKKAKHVIDRVNNSEIGRAVFDDSIRLVESIAPHCSDICVVDRFSFSTKSVENG